MNPPIASRRLRPLITTVVALALASPLSMAAPAQAAPSQPGEPSPGRGSDVTVATSRVVAERHDRPVRLPRPVSGRRAVQLLGDDLPAAAHANDMSAARLRGLLLNDPAAVVDGTGRLLYIDPVPTDEHADEHAAEHGDEHGAEHADEGTTSAASTTTAATSLAQTFALHSKPGARRTIFLDFDGTDVSGTQWNNQFGVASGWHGAWDPAKDGATFNDSERTRIQSIWARVAEDFSPFDVDVTTEDPGAAAITRSGTSDQVFGTRVLITTSTQASGAICSSGCGGVAFVDVFDEPTYHAQLQPAWVFSHSLSHDTKSIAEAATHEAGHNLALDHDATSTSGYYEGHGSWAPIMGVGYNRPLVQWSRGGYAGANNTQDDLAIIAASGAPLRADEAGASVGAAAGALPTGPAYVTSDADRDVYALGTCRGTVSLTADPASTSPNLDLSVELLDANGVTVGRADPPSAAIDWDRMSGLAATVKLTDVPAGSYFVRVDGVGTGSALTAYDGYGSLGAYTVTASGCGVTGQPPAAPTGVSGVAGADGRSATLSWAAPADDGGSAVTGYVVSRDGAAVATLSGTARSHTVTGLVPGATTTLSVAAVNGIGTGQPASATVTTPTAPGMPSGVTGSRDASAGTATLAWSAPSSDGGSSLTGYQVRLDAGAWTAAGSTGRHVFSGVDDGAHQLAVRAVNAVGAGTPAVVEVAAVPVPTTEPTTEPLTETTTTEPPTSTPPPPPPVTGVEAPTDLATTVDALAGTARLSWLAPVTGTAGPVIGYQVLRDGVVVGGTAPDTRTVTFTGLLRGTTVDLGVRAVDSLGLGPVASVQVTVAGAPPAPERLTVSTRSGVATVRWEAPASYDVGLVTGWRVRALRGGVPVDVRTLAADARSWSHRLKKKSSTVLEVAALSGPLLGATAATAPVQAAARPSRPRIRWARGDGRTDARVTAVLAWRAPASTGQAPVLGYRVVGHRLDVTARVLQRRAWRAPAGQERTRLRLPSRGTWIFSVRAVSEAGVSPASRPSPPVRAR